MEKEFKGSRMGICTKEAISMVSLQAMESIIGSMGATLKGTF